MKMPEIVIETERLILRTESQGDLEDYLKKMNTPAVMEYLGGVKEPHEVEAKFAKNHAMRAKYGHSFMMVQHKATGDLMGNCGLKRVDNPLASCVDDFEIGWLIRDDYWRQGYALEAAKACLELAFERLDAPHVVALTSQRNTGSWKIMEKLGMKRRPDLDFSDPEYPPEDNPTIFYAITAKEWHGI